MRTFILDKTLQDMGLGIVDLAKLSGVSRNTIDDIRRNNGSGRRRPTIEKLATALNLEYDDLFEETSEDVPSSRKTTGIDNSELVDIAEQYEDEGNLAMYQKLRGIATLIGSSVEALLEKGDALYSAGDEDGAKGAYSQAILALKLRHISRLKQSLPNFLSLCEKDHNAPPIIALYRMAIDRQFDDLELFYLIGIFFARSRQAENLINECFDIVKAIIVRED